MSEKDNLPKADGKKTQKKSPEGKQELNIVTDSNLKNTSEPNISPNTDTLELETVSKESVVNKVIAKTSDDKGEHLSKVETVIEEIESANAKDSEVSDEAGQNKISEKDYHDMSMEGLINEFEILIATDKIRSIRQHVDTIRKEFDSKFNAHVATKKEAFISDGGNVIDFEYNSTLKEKYNILHKTYRNKLKDFYKNLESSLKVNHAKRLEIIEEIKGLLNVEENINTTYKHFKQLQEDWKNTGPIPRDKYNNVWNNYHHHVERFYDFLHLNRDLRDLDFKHNLDQKLKLIDRAEELSKDNNSNRAFRELQALHKIWKEELGPVEREQREEIWERFSAATKLIHEKRQVYFKEVDKVYEKNLELKHDIISQIDTITSNESNNHSIWQKKIKQIEDLRMSFFNAGKVPIKVNEETWAKFKESVRAFNRKKNSFYKDLKKDQYQNLQKKLELIKIAEENKASTDFLVTTPLMKKIQNDWKKIGHVPRRESDKIWNQFKSACNLYFDNLHESKNTANKEELEALEKKNNFLEEIKKINLTDNKSDNIKLINDHINTWKAIGHVPYNKRAINKKFNTVIESLFNKLDISKNESELLKYNHKLENFSNDRRSLDNEHNFIRKKIDEVKSEINQLENNLQFFSNVKDDNPLVKDVHKNIKKYKEALELWKEKLKQIKQFY
ncbi:DUF349 domain-containing protein [Flavobacteriaceae bacterium]|jgi:hypothetical protein|nr:DUF349 domain-containing protein [Flavobacteriaceae bacterium]